MTYTFATVATAEGDRAALVVAGTHYRLDRLITDLAAPTLRALLDDWDWLLDKCDGLVAAPLDPRARVDDPLILSPVRFPNKLVCVGAVYSDHLEQMDLPPERWPNMPMFLRPPTTSIVGPGRTVMIPANTKQFDWEIELAVVIGRTLTAVDEKTATEGIAGYSVGIDLTCRDLLDRGSAVGVDLIRAKAQDKMAPIGPCLAPARFVADPGNLGLRLWINGEQRQNGTTASMLFSVAEQLATISRYITLEPGDIVFTGSPAGSARSDDQFLRPGDHIRAEIDQVGRLDLELYAHDEAETTHD